MGLTRALNQCQATSGKTQRVAAYVCLVIVQLVLIHMLHLSVSPDATTAHDPAVGERQTHTIVSSTDPDTDNGRCSAPGVVSQRVDSASIAMAIDPLTIIVAQMPLHRVSAGTDCDLPRPPGPERQASLQRFML